VGKRPVVINAARGGLEVLKRLSKETKKQVGLKERKAGKKAKTL